MAGIVRLCLIFTFSSGLFVSNEGFSQSWDLVKDEDGIKIYTRLEPGNSIKSYRGVAELKEPSEEVFSLISDVYQYDWWGDDIKKVEVLKYDRGKSASYYLEYSLPWPIDNRDLAVDVTFKADPGGKSYVSTAIANPGLVSEKKGKVRMKNYRQSWTITSRGEDSCQVILEGYADPSGNVPDWVVNMSVKDSPFKAIKGLREKLLEK